MKLRPKITLIDHFEKLTDPRIDRTKDHKLIDILTIAICGMICGEEVQQLFALAEAQDWSGIEHSFDRTIEKGHGRIEIRRYWTMATNEFFLDRDQWAGLQSIGLVESVRKIGTETTTSKRYYLNSFASDARLLAHAVRSHWGIENQLHWVLDVALAEDDCPIHSNSAPENLARLRQMALNLLSSEKTAKIGVANKRLKAAWDNDYLAKVLGI